MQQARKCVLGNHLNAGQSSRKSLYKRQKSTHLHVGPERQLTGEKNQSMSLDYSYRFAEDRQYPAIKQDDLPN